VKQFEEWLAATWSGSLAKISTGAALGAVLSYLLTSDVHPLIVAIGSAVIPILINAINPQDPRYGEVDWEDLDGDTV
jgi:hypothetical protein